MTRPSTHLQDLLNAFAHKEQEAMNTSFLAPCVKGGDVCTRINGIVYTFNAEPSDYEGWGIFKPKNPREAMIAEEASLPLVDRYLNLFPALRLRLAFKIQEASWLAFPTNIADVKQRFGEAEPFTVHLVENGQPFQTIVARRDGSTFWFHEHDYPLRGKRTPRKPNADVWRFCGAGDC